MKPIEQLQEILCTVESVRDDMNRVEFIVSTVWDKSLGIEGKRIHNNVRTLEVKTKEEALGIAISEFQKKDGNEGYIFLFDIICENKQSLSLKHLFTYCEEKGISKMNLLFQYMCNYNHKLELYEQEDKVLLDIINLLKG